MNRYELHQKLKEAEEAGRKVGFEEGRKQLPYRSPMGHGHPLPLPVAQPIPSATSKYRCRVEINQSQNTAAYEMRATLFINNRYYNAIQTIGYEHYEQIRVNGSITDYMNRWLEGAYLAMWKEFKKDVIFELPSS